MSRFALTPKTSTLALTTLLLFPSCSRHGTETDNPMGPEGIEFRRSALAYDSSVEVLSVDREALSEGNRAFALDLYRDVAARAPASENLFLGTHSISTVLAMTFAGARGATESEMVTALKHGLSQTALPPAMNGLAQEIQGGIAGTDVRYDSFNSLWLSQQHATEATFLDVLSQHYDTGLYLVDFIADAEGSRNRINAWISDQTGGLIEQLFDAASLGSNTKLALTNAVYLSAPWQDRFDPAETTNAEFTLADGTVVDVPMMGRTWTYPAAFNIDWRALELPFRDAAMGMVFVLPNVGEWDAFEQSFDAALASDIVTALVEARAEDQMVHASVPRFDFAASQDLQPSLEALGMVSAFDLGTANFTGIDPVEGLAISSFVHQTTVGVDEEGTTAAAATGQVMVPLAITPAINLNRPFHFFIYDHVSESVLFIGRLVRPAGEIRTPAEPIAIPSDAQVICAGLALCPSRTIAEAECLDALAADGADALEQCADCVQWGLDACGGLPACGRGPGNICEPSACAEYCPAHAF